MLYYMCYMMKLIIKWYIGILEKKEGSNEKEKLYI